ncbi:MAG: hypothetical protein VW472_08020, partial [Candidatus Puniceispirillum sp.]
MTGTTSLSKIHRRHHPLSLPQFALNGNHKFGKKPEKPIKLAAIMSRVTSSSSRHRSNGDQAGSDASDGVMICFSLKPV